jgi:hypothetical protein
MKTLWVASWEGFVACWSCWLFTRPPVGCCCSSSTVFGTGYHRFNFSFSPDDGPSRLLRSALVALSP